MHEYWQNQLEVPLSYVLARTTCAPFFSAWIDDLNPACRRVLAGELGLPHDMPLPAQRRAFLRFRERLVPLVLVDAAMAGKRLSALVEVARAVLGDGDLQEVRAGGRLDRRALGWILYLRGAPNLLRVFHVDRTHRRGVARLALAQRPSVPVASSHDAVCRSRIAAILADYQRECGFDDLDPRADSLTTGEQHVVFFRWPKKHAFVVRGADNVFGYNREWVVLAFSRDFWRVRIVSDCREAAARIAEQIASAVLGEAVRYVNESVATPLETADRFVGSLLDDEGEMPLVEAEVRAGDSLLRVHNPHDDSIGPQLQRLQMAFGPDLTRADRVEAVKVVAFGKRVRMIFEPSGASGVVIRYSDQVLAPMERAAFERQMQDSFGITVLSTEKRHAA